MVNPRVVVIIGPSASGKSSVVRRLHRQGLIRVQPTWTTRGRREDERFGSIEHRFVSEARFDELAVDRFFLETASAFGLPYRYGLPRFTPGWAGRPDVVMLREAFVPRFAELVPGQVVYQIEDSLDRRRSRLRRRGGSPAELAARLGDDPAEIGAGRQVADRVFVNDGSLDALVDAVATALRRDVA